MSKDTSTSSGIGVWGLLGIAFIVLKLTGVIDWSWWWVTLPLWLGPAIFLIVLITLFIFAGGATIKKKK
jgi:phosphoglycerol transferase MdoB-like AlkP superfamily enzyme